MSEKCPDNPNFLPALVIGIALVLAGFFVQKGLTEFRSFDRSVSVKGLAQQNVEADLVIWPIKHAATGSDLPTVQSDVEANTQKIIAFLKAQGLTDADIVSRKIELTDLLAQSYRQNNASQNNRYIIAETVSVRTDKVGVVETAAQNVGDLLKQGVSLSRENNTGNPQYIFTKLNDIKPQMIAEATQSARDAAQQFANDSGTSVGNIKSAYQGVFQILPRDSNQSYQEREERYKTVRVVSTLQFYLD